MACAADHIDVRSATRAANGFFDLTRELPIHGHRRLRQECVVPHRQSAPPAISPAMRCQSFHRAVSNNSFEPMTHIESQTVSFSGNHVWLLPALAVKLPTVATSPSTRCASRSAEVIHSAAAAIASRR